MVDIQSPTAEIRRAKKRRRKKQDERKYIWSALLHRATIKKRTIQMTLSHTSHKIIITQYKSSYIEEDRNYREKYNGVAIIRRKMTNIK